MLIMHTREGHKPDLSDLHETKKTRGRGAMTIGDLGPMGRILVIGEPGHDIIPELYPVAGEPVIDKPGKGAFYNTELSNLIEKDGISQLIVCGVTTEVCVHTTVREANDRGLARSEEHTFELQSPTRISYADFRLKTTTLTNHIKHIY